METHKLDNGNPFLLVSIEGPGGVPGDGVFETRPDHPEAG